MLLIFLLPVAAAAGYHLVRVDAIYGRGDFGAARAGIGLSVLDDQFGYWMTFGNPDTPDDGTGHRLKQAWIEGSWYGYQLGDPPMALMADYAEPWAKLARPMARDETFFPYSFGRFGVDHDTRRNLVFDWSQHMALSIPGIWGVPPRHFHFGPSVGIGLNLTWWERWKGTSTDPNSAAYGADYVVNTGKITAEAGWLAGVTWLDTLYAQARGTASYDLFGVHQTDLNAAGVVGAFLGRLGVPFGVELRGEMDRGNDNVTTLHERRWSARASVFWKQAFPPPDPSAAEVEHLIEMLHQIEAEQDSAPPAEAGPKDAPADRPAWDAEDDEPPPRAPPADDDASKAGGEAEQGGDEGTGANRSGEGAHDPRQGPQP